MKFSFEVPITYLKKFDKVNDYHFILAHLLQESEEYYKFYKNSKKYKILDNGAAEKNESIDIKDLINLAVDINTNVLVLPDKLMDGKKTFEMSIDTYFKIKSEKPKLFNKIRLMYVLQGSSLSEMELYWEKFKHIVNDNNVIVGLPYRTCGKIMSLYSPYRRDDDVTNARIYIVQYLKLYKGPYQIHLLGAGFNFTQELSFMRHYTNVITTDTSTPFVLANNHTYIDKSGLYQRTLTNTNRINFNESFSKEKLKLAIHNAKVIKEFAKL